jgi:hypothetical protein
MIAHELKMKVIQVSSIEQWLSIPKPESRKCKKIPRPVPDTCAPIMERTDGPKHRNVGVNVVVAIEGPGRVMA